MLRTRILTALILAPLLIWLLLKAPNSYLMPVFLACVAVSSWELNRVFAVRANALADEHTEILVPILGSWPLRLRSMRFFEPAVASTTTTLGFLALNLLSLERGVPAFAFLFVTAGIIHLLSSENMERAVFRCISGGFTMIYCVFPWTALWRLQGVGESGVYILFTLVVVFLGDTGGYFGGRFLGKRKLAPSLSPKKTVEGAGVGLAASVLSALLLNHLFSMDLGNSLVIALIALGGGVAAQLGDLFESGLKRFCGVKDSGGIIPGHGGLLDRVDGVLFAAPWFWFCFVWS